jgi:hypothetical protein
LRLMPVQCGSYPPGTNQMAQLRLVAKKVDLLNQLMMKSHFDPLKG